MEVGVFIAGLAIFFGAHLFTTFRKRGPGDIREKMGRGPYMGLYSLVSLIGLVMLAWGWRASQPLMGHVWDPPPWTRHLALTLMLPALILIIAANAPVGYIKKVTRHPMLVGVKLWAVIHLAANGEVADIILFGSFLAYAVVDRIALAKRGDKGPVGVKPNILGDMIAISGGILTYLLVAWVFHPLVVGVPILG